jgi:hypothetical protein
LLSANRFASLIVMCGFALTASAGAAQTLRLSTVAAAYGYTYQWMTNGAAATLARPGVRIVIRAGRAFYEVNDATPVADVAPSFDGRDLVISQALAEHLRLIALKYPYPAAIPPAAPPQAVTGALTITAKQIPGRDALVVSGTGPVNIPVMITLLGQLSADIPTVTLLKKTVMTTTDGNYSAEVYYGQDTHVGTFLAATATSVDGVTSAATRVTIGIPSAGFNASAFDYWPAK